MRGGFSSPPNDTARLFCLYSRNIQSSLHELDTKSSIPANLFAGRPPRLLMKSTKSTTLWRTPMMLHLARVWRGPKCHRRHLFRTVYQWRMTTKTRPRHAMVPNTPNNQLDKSFPLAIQTKNEWLLASFRDNLMPYQRASSSWTPHLFFKLSVSFTC